MLQIRKHVYFSDLGFIILFVGILPLYAINLGAMSLFVDSPFTFLAMFVFDVLYRFEWMNIVLFLSKKKEFKKWIVSCLKKYNILLPVFWPIFRRKKNFEYKNKIISCPIGKLIKENLIYLKKISLVMFLE